ncbi:MAG: hypothetical protein LLH30_13615 [Candidatus Manganitrophus sp. SA1]|nr:hypothetical protein [Candidatus Manganitrophus morganii]
MMITTKDLLQYLFIFLVLLWPVWVLGLVFLRWLLQTAGSFLIFKTEKLAPREKGLSKPAEPLIGTS